MSSKPWGKSAVAAELQGMVRECVQRAWLPPDFQVRRITGISLRRGGNSAAAVCGVDSLVRAAQGRWLCTETPDEKYTMLHRSKMVSLATGAVVDTPCRLPLHTSPTQLPCPIPWC